MVYILEFTPQSALFIILFILFIQCSRYTYFNMHLYVDYKIMDL